MDMDFSGNLKEIRFSFNFDLKIELLKEIYPSDRDTSYNEAWTKIKLFMEKNDFQRTQYSGYESVVSMTYAKAYIILEGLNDRFPRFVKCANAATLTEIGEQYDVLKHFSISEEEINPPTLD